MPTTPRNIVLYKLPFALSFTRIESAKEAIIVPDCALIGEQSGFIVAPFSTENKRDKIVLIQPDVTSEHDILPLSTGHNAEATAPTMPSAEYNDVFEQFHRAVSTGQFTKLVLARTKNVAAANINIEELFLRACAMYPRQLVALVSTPETGTWLTCTPEILLSADNNSGSTMALAGTMPWTGGNEKWSTKNRGEQKVVANYIEQCLQGLVANLQRSETYSRRAADLAHLCTDFTFTLSENTKIGQLINRLHPTPAVCGMPKNEAREFILHNEQLDRKYYSGFMGPVNIAGKTQLFVSLRCAEIASNNMTLYAGGGIMPDSTVESEWQETERKMATILNVKCKT